MTPHETLGVSPDADAVTVREAYAAKVKADHPDHGGTGAMLKALKRARDEMLGVSPAPAGCRICGGRGWVKSKGFKPERCPRGC